MVRLHAASTAARELVWLRSLMSSIGYPCDKPTILFIDNQSAIKLCNDAKYHKRTGHIDIRYHYIREKKENGEIEVQYVPNEIQKAICSEKHYHAIDSKPGLKVSELLRLVHIMNGGSIEDVYPNWLIVNPIDWKRIFGGTTISSA